MTKSAEKFAAKRAAALEIIRAAGGSVVYRWSEGRDNLHLAMTNSSGARVKGLRADFLDKLVDNGDLSKTQVPSGVVGHDGEKSNTVWATKKAPIPRVGENFTTPDGNTWVVRAVVDGFFPGETEVSLVNGPFATVHVIKH